MILSFENFEESDVSYVFGLAKNCSYVVGNPDYTKKASQTKLTFSHTKNVVNAWACSHSDTRHEINIFGGLSNAFHFMSYALAEFDHTSDLDRLKRACRWAGRKSLNGFSFEDIQRGCEAVRINPSKKLELEAHSYWIGHMLAVVAHELGHICLSHTMRNETSNTCSRNDERQADLFAFSVVATTPFAKYTALATLFVDILFDWMGGGDADSATTHPHSRERVLNCLASNHAVYREYGITSHNIEDFLPTENDFQDEEEIDEESN